MPLEDLDAILLSMTTFLMIAMWVIFLLSIATISDLSRREIPDSVSAAIAATGLLCSATGWLGLAPALVLAGGLTGLLVGWLLFHFAHFGGGDAKLLGALGCIVGPFGMLIVLIAMGIAGGVLSLIAISRGQRDFAYAPAITTGFLGYVGVVSHF